MVLEILDMLFILQAVEAVVAVEVAVEQQALVELVEQEIMLLAQGLVVMVEQVEQVLLEIKPLEVLEILQQDTVAVAVVVVDTH
jgi:hypothetical protein